MTLAPEQFEGVRQGRPMAHERARIERRLLDAARASFIELGYTDTTIDVIAKRARASKRTIYSRFESKAGLFEAIVTDLVDRLFQPTDGIVREASANKAGSLRDRLLRIGAAFLDAATSPDTVALDAMVTAQARAFPMLAARLQAKGHDRAVSIIRKMLDEAGAQRAAYAAEAFYALLVIAPMRSDQILGVVPPPDPEDVVDFILAGAGLTT